MKEPVDTLLIYPAGSEEPWDALTEVYLKLARKNHEVLYMIEVIQECILYATKGIAVQVAIGTRFWCPASRINKEYMRILR